MKKIWVIDWKSSSGVWDEMKTQVCTYARMEPELSVECAGVLRLDKETGKLDDPPVVDCTEEIEKRWKAFLSLRAYYKDMIEADLSEKKKERFYPHNGKRFPTITTILDVLNKPALPQWAANSTVEYVREHLAEMTDEKQIEYYLKKAKTAYREKSKVAMDTGSIVHDAIHCYLSGAKPEEALKENDQATNSFLAFLEWADKVKLEPIALEKVLINEEYEIGGTVDFVGYADIEGATKR